MVPLIFGQKVGSTFRTECLTANQKCSIGLRSGEYGGKNKTLHPAFSINSLTLSDL